MTRTISCILKFGCSPGKSYLCSFQPGDIQWKDISFSLPSTDVFRYETWRRVSMLIYNLTRITNSNNFHFNNIHESFQNLLIKLCRTYGCYSNGHINSIEKKIVDVSQNHRYWIHLHKGRKILNTHFLRGYVPVAG